MFAPTCHDRSSRWHDPSLSPGGGTTCESPADVRVRVAAPEDVGGGSSWYEFVGLGLLSSDCQVVSVSRSCWPPGQTSSSMVLGYPERVPVLMAIPRVCGPAVRVTDTVPSFDCEVVASTWTPSK